MFFKFICLFSALMDIIICLPSAIYFSNSYKPSTRMPSFEPNDHVPTRLLQNMPLQQTLDNKVHQKSVQELLESRVFLDFNVPSNKKPSFSPMLTKIFQTELSQQLRREEMIVENTLRPRGKRGIVLIDEDFNVPPEPGVKQSWGDGDFDKKDIEIMSTEEGSGQIDVFTNDTLLTTTPEQLHIPTNKTKVYEKKISTSVLNDKLTSTPSLVEKVTATSEHADKMVSTFEQADTETSVEYTDKIVTDEIEGSGEISVQLTQIPPTKEDPKEETSTIKACLKDTCDPDDLLLSPGNARKVPEGTNLTLSCSLVNASEHGFLKLYKYNDSEHLLLEESNKGLNFDIPLSQRHNSGTYMCLKLADESCCHQQLDITVYEVPNYKTHLIVIGLIAAISLFLCILLGIYRSFKTKNYEIQMELQNMDKPVLF